MKRKLLIIAVFFVCLVFLLLTVFYIVKYSGKNNLTQNNKEPTLPKLEQEAEEDKSAETEYSVKYNGKKYKYNDKMINILLIGVDTEKQDETMYGASGNADVLLLGCINTETDEVKIISIPRDTVCDVVVYDYQGESAGTQRLPISLSHAYGDGGDKSAELTVNAVSELLYGLPIHAWYTLNTLSIKVINDAVGGVPIIPDENSIRYLPGDAVIGEEYLLKGVYARGFVVHRYEESDSTRRVRQKQYLSSFVQQAKKAFSKNPLIVVDLYKKIDNYSATSLTLDEIVWLAGEVAGMNISTDFVSLKGEEIQGETMTEFHVDETSLYETMLDIFYIEVE